MKGEELVSIVMPAYNVEKYIEESIESVLYQTYLNWELIIVNDCSLDNTYKIIKKYHKKDSRIKSYSLLKNQGVSNARNIAINNAKGKYITFLDSDDIWLPEKLSRQIKFMEENNYIFTFHEYSHFEEIDKPKKLIKVPRIVDYKSALKGNNMGCLTVCIDRTRVKKFTMPNEKHEDYITWLNILKINNISAYGIQENLAMYRINNNNSISGNKFKSCLWTWNIYRKNQKINLAYSIYCFINYFVKGILKHW